MLYSSSNVIAKWNYYIHFKQFITKMYCQHFMLSKQSETIKITRRRKTSSDLPLLQDKDAHSSTDNSRAEDVTFVYLYMAHIYQILELPTLTYFWNLNPLFVVWGEGVWSCQRFPWELIGHKTGLLTRISKYFPASCPPPPPHSGHPSRLNLKIYRISNSIEVH